MTSEEFAAGVWLDRLARALRSLAEVQAPYLQVYCRQDPRVHTVFEERGGNPLAFHLDDLRDLYARALHGNVFGEEEDYTPLCAVLIQRSTGPSPQIGESGTIGVRAFLPVPQAWSSSFMELDSMLRPASSQ